VRKMLMAAPKTGQMVKNQAQPRMGAGQRRLLARAVFKAGAADSKRFRRVSASPRFLCALAYPDAMRFAWQTLACRLAVMLMMMDHPRLL